MFTIPSTVLFCRLFVVDVSKTAIVNQSKPQFFYTFDTRNCSSVSELNFRNATRRLTKSSILLEDIREFLRLTFQCVFWCDRKTQSLTFKSVENFQLKNEKNRRVRCFLLYFPEFMWPNLCFVNNNAPKSTCWTWKIPFLFIFGTKMHRSMTEFSCQGFCRPVLHQDTLKGRTQKLTCNYLITGAFFYQPDIMICFSFSDIDECASNTTNDCDVNANCNNTDGGHNCTCKNGYHGNGTVCKGKCQ